MPIYEYRCEHCGVFEEMQRITDPPLARCPSCKRKVRGRSSRTRMQRERMTQLLPEYFFP